MTDFGPSTPRVPWEPAHQSAEVGRPAGNCEVEVLCAGVEVGPRQCDAHAVGGQRVWDDSDAQDGCTPETLCTQERQIVMSFRVTPLRLRQNES